MRTLGFALAVVSLGVVVAGGNEVQPRLTAPGYYMAARASYQNSSQIEVGGQTNLPPGSVITAQVFTFVGVGAEALSRKAEMVVKQDQTFLTWLEPRIGKEFSFTPPGHSYPHNPICEITFDPTAPDLRGSRTSAQPASVIGIVGQYGQSLGKDWKSNPQVYCGKAICFLQVDVPVTD